jgi:uncharacterized phage-like protein YoqJ
VHGKIIKITTKKTVKHNLFVPTESNTSNIKDEVKNEVEEVLEEGNISRRSSSS